MKLKAELSNEARSLMARLGSSQRVLQAMRGALERETQATWRHITMERMRGNDGTPFPASQGILGVRTGRYRQALRATRAVISGQSVVSGIGANLKYAGIHEFGGKTPAHIIEPRKKKGTLAFQIGGRLVFAKMVKHPGSRIPERAPVRRGIEDRLPQLSEALSGACIGAWAQ